MLRLDTWALVCLDIDDAIGKAKPPNRYLTRGFTHLATGFD